MRRRAARVVLFVAGLCVAVVTLSSCGASQYTYVTNSAEHTYFKVPAAWHALDQHQLEQTLGAAPEVPGEPPAFWVQGYDAADQPSLDHMVGSESEMPVVFASVLDVPQQARGSMSLDSLRNRYLPVTADARAQSDASGSSPFSDFQLIDEQVLTPGSGIRGVREVFAYRISGGALQVFDETGYINDDASRAYTLMMRCSAACYKQRRDEIQTVVTSFTVKETK